MAALHMSAPISAEDRLLWRWGKMARSQNPNIFLRGSQHPAEQPYHFRDFLRGLKVPFPSARGFENTIA